MKCKASSQHEKENVVYYFQISLFVPEIFKFSKYAVNSHGHGHGLNIIKMHSATFYFKLYITARCICAWIQKCPNLSAPQ